MHKKRVACTNKMKYKDFKSAFVATKILKKQKNLISTVYLCKRCGFYHVGKPSYYDNPYFFWCNIFNQMSEHDKEVLKVN